MWRIACGWSGECCGDVYGESGDGRSVEVDKEHLAATQGQVRVVAINAGNANCAAGQAGLDAARATCEAAAEVFGCEAEEVFPSSTGIIGVPLPAEKLIAAMPAAEGGAGGGVGSFSAGGAGDFDDGSGGEDGVCADLEIDGKEVRIAGVGKGSGMIHPRLVPHATMLMYLLTDAEIEPAVMQRMMRRVVEVSFNRISVDGDTSTNDTVLLLARGGSGARVDEGDAEFEAVLTQVAISLARQVVADGEGVRHVVELQSERGVFR